MSNVAHQSKSSPSKKSLKGTAGEKASKSEPRLVEAPAPSPAAAPRNTFQTWLAQQRRQRAKAWSVLVLSTVDEPTDAGDRLREQAAWVSLFIRQFAAGHESRPIDIEEVISTLLSLSADVDQLLIAYEFGTGEAHHASVSDCTIPEEHGDKFGLAIRVAARDVEREFNAFQAGDGDVRRLHAALAVLTSISLEVDGLAGWFGRTAPAAQESDEDKPLRAAAEAGDMAQAAE